MSEITVDFNGAEIVVEVGENTYLARDAAMRAEGAADLAEQLTGYLLDTDSIGVARAPQDGTALGGGEYLFERPLRAGAVSVRSIDIYLKTLGTIALRRYNRAGSALTLLSTSAFEASGALGLRTFTTEDFGGIVLGAGEYLSIQAPGVGTYTAGPEYGAGYYTVVASAIGAVEHTNVIEVRVNYAYEYLRTLGDLNEERLDAINGGEVEIGRPAGAALTAGLSASNQTYLWVDPLANSGRLRSLDLYAGAPGSLRIARYSTGSGGEVELAGTSPLIAIGSAGVVHLTERDFGNFPLQAGDRLAVDHADILVYTAAAETNGSGFIDAGGESLPDTITLLPGVTSVRPQIRFTAYLDVDFAGLIAGAAGAPAYTQGASLFSWRARLANLAVNSTGKAKLLLTGDSWAQKPAIAQALADLLYDEYGKAGEGWVSSWNGGDSESVPINGVTYANANWTGFDAGQESGVAALPAFGCALDGLCISTTGTTATASISGFTSTEARIYYAQTAGGKFRYRLDGGGWTTITGNGSGALGIVTITGLAATSHTLEIDTTVNTGGTTAAIFGYYLTNTAGVGVEVIKAGNSNLSAGDQLASFADTYITPIATNLAPDLVLTLIGTNDYRRAGSSPAAYVAALGELVAAYRAANPRAGFIFVAPARSNVSAVTGTLAQYRDALWKFCQEGGHELYNMHDEWSTWANENALGMWNDNLHLNGVGAHRLAARINGKLLA